VPEVVRGEQGIDQRDEVGLRRRLKFAAQRVVAVPEGTAAPGATVDAHAPVPGHRSIARSSVASTGTRNVVVPWPGEAGRSAGGVDQLSNVRHQEGVHALEVDDQVNRLRRAVPVADRLDRNARDRNGGGSNSVLSSVSSASRIAAGIAPGSSGSPVRGCSSKDHSAVTPSP
jgi:hypothetical protein